MSDPFLTIAAWCAALLGLVLVAYTLKKWRLAAKACYPMPFRRPKAILAVWHSVLYSLRRQLSCMATH